MYFQNESTFFEFIKSTIGIAKYSGDKKEIITYCPNCESASNKSHGHLYIGLDVPLYNCFKCDNSGVVDKLIVSVGGNPNELMNMDSLSKFKNNRGTYKKPIFYSRPREYEKYNTSVAIPTDDSFEPKINYIKKRLINMTSINDIPNVILDYKTFLKESNALNVVSDNMLEYLQTDFVGFLTEKKTTVISRNINDFGKIRYHKLKLEDGYGDFYSIKIKDIDFEVPTFLIAEGPFDVLSCYFSAEMKQYVERSNYLIAILGKYYNNVISYILDYYGIPKGNFIVVSDPEIPDNYYNKLKQHPQINRLEIYWNSTGDDFGSTTHTPVKKYNYIKNKYIRRRH